MSLLSSIPIFQVDSLINRSGEYKVGELRDEMQDIMQKHFSVFRTEKTLADGLKMLNDCNAKIGKLNIATKSMIWNTELVEAYELMNLMSCSLQIAKSALERKESRGAHSRYFSYISWNL